MTASGEAPSPSAAARLRCAHPRLLDTALAQRALRDAVRKLAPRHMAGNPVMLMVEVGSALTSLLFLRRLFWARAGEGSELGFTFQISLWLWLTVLLANLAEAVAEGRGKAQADTLRRSRTLSTARLLRRASAEPPADEAPPRQSPAAPPPAGSPPEGSPQRTGLWGSACEELVTAASLQRGDVVRCLPGDTIPGDGEVIDGIASVDESAITGESAPVIRESGGDRSAVTGGTRVLSDGLVVRITSNPGESFLDRMIGLVEGAARQKTPNEVALHTLLTGLSLVFLLVVATLLPFAWHAGLARPGARPPSLTALVSLLACLAPTTIGGLLSAIGIAGMDRVMQHNVLAMSGRAVEAAGDVDTLLLDKTGTITLGNRQAVELIPVGGVTEHELAEAAQLSSLADETPEGRSIVVLAKEHYGLRGVELAHLDARFIPFTAQTRMSGLEVSGTPTMKGAADAVISWVSGRGGDVPPTLREVVERVSRAGGTPLVVATPARPLGVIHLKDVVKGGMRERFTRLRAMGIKTVMITGDNPITAAAIAREAGVDDFLAEATPETKMRLIMDEQALGKRVAMAGDGTNDAPALAQADVGVAMNTGTSAAKEAGNMVDLDSNPTKLIEIVEIGKQLLITRGALTTFSLANDVAKYFAIVPAIFASTYPELGWLNLMGLHSPQSAILASVIFNALIIVALLPLALRGVRYPPMDTGDLLRHNLLLFGGGGVIAPFPGIWLLDRLLGLLGWA